MSHGLFSTSATSPSRRAASRRQRRYRELGEEDLLDTDFGYVGMKSISAKPRSVWNDIEVQRLHIQRRDESMWLHQESEFKQRALALAFAKQEDRRRVEQWRARRDEVDMPQKHTVRLSRVSPEPFLTVFNIQNFA